MPKRVISFKPTAECEVQLAELMGRWKCDRTAAIVRAIEIVCVWERSEERLSVEPVLIKDKVARQMAKVSGDRKKGAKPAPKLPPKVLPKDPKAVVEMVARDVGEPPKPRPGKTEPIKAETADGSTPGPHGPNILEKDTRTQQERMDDFYRANMAKGKK